MNHHPVSEPAGQHQSGFAVGSNEPVAAALSRVLDEDIRWIEAAIGVRDTDRVHALRRRMKRCRALLRALAPAVPAAGVAREALREAAAAMGPIRDRQVREAMRAELAAPDGMAARRTEPAKETASRDSEAFDTAAKAAARARAALAGFEMTSGRRVMNEAFRRAVKRQRKAFRRAAVGETDSFHRWRRALQDLVSLCAFGGTRLGRGTGLRREAEKIVALLGKDHDLALLQGAAHGTVQGLAERRARLQRSALRQGRRLATAGPPFLRRRSA